MLAEDDAAPSKDSVRSGFFLFLGGLPAFRFTGASSAGDSTASGAGGGSDIINAGGRLRKEGERRSLPRAPTLALEARGFLFVSSRESGGTLRESLLISYLPLALCSRYYPSNTAWRSAPPQRALASPHQNGLAVAGTNGE